MRLPACIWHSGSRARSVRGLTILLLMLCLGGAKASEVKVRVIALFTDQAMLEVGDQRKIVKKGETFEGVLLVSASGRGAVVVVDGERLKLGLNQSAIASSYKKPERRSLKIYPDAAGMYFVEGAINGQRTRFVVDTGATNVTLSGEKAKQLKIDFTRGVRSSLETAAAVVPAWEIRLDSVSVGGIRVNNVDAIVVEGDQPFDVLLGNSFLRHTVMQKAGTAMELKKRF